MGENLYIDTQALEQGIYLGITSAMSDLTPLFRAAYVFELQEVTRRIEIFELADWEELDIPAKRLKIALVRRREELLVLLWPPIDDLPDPDPMGV